jgi:uncharacterized protein (DUF488 family)
MNNTAAGKTFIYTIGHSTRTQDELLELLRHYGVATLGDIRTVPRSRRVPWFNRETLSITLPEAGIRYAHLPGLGGLRRGLGAASPNTAWRNEGFRNYADYMLTDGFWQALDELIALAGRECTAIMCAEAVPWRCHRSLVADALTLRGLAICHIIARQRCQQHELTPFAHVENGRLVYPGDPLLPFREV